MVPSIDNELEMLDVLKMANRVLFLVSAAKDLHFNSEQIDEFGNKLLYSVFGQVCRYIFQKPQNFYKFNDI